MHNMIYFLVIVAFIMCMWKCNGGVKISLYGTARLKDKIKEN